jgi:peptidoglycan/LPS O-acetylase OafA/YrhL
VTAILQQGWHPNYINTVVPGGWSIAVEATFYIIAPLLFLRIKDWRAALGFLLVALFASMAANGGVQILKDHHLIFQQVLPDLSRRFLYEWFPNQLPAFACGILAYYILKSIPGTFRSKRNGLLLLAAGAMFVYSMVGIGGHRLIGEHVFFTLGFVMLILALAIYPAGLLVNFATCFLGRISYSCYLMHFVILQGVVPYFHCFSWLLNSHSFEAFATLVAVTTVLTMLVSWMTFNVIEQPFIRLGASLARRLNSGSEYELKNRAVPA